MDSTAPTAGPTPITGPAPTAGPARTVGLAHPEAPAPTEQPAGTGTPARTEQPTPGPGTDANRAAGRGPVPGGLLLRSRALARTLPDGVLCGRSAAALWGDDSAAEGTIPEIWLPSTGEARPGRLYRYGPLPTHAICEIDGVRVTAPLRTCRDLAAGLVLEDAVVAVERLCASVAELPGRLRAVVRHPSCSGARRFVAVVAACDPLSGSALSTRARLTLAEAGCGDFRHGHRVVLGTGPVELPLADPAARCVVFTTGRSPGPESAARHRSVLQRAGWSVIVVRERATGGGRAGSRPSTVTGPSARGAAVPRRAAAVLAARWPGTELRLPAATGSADDPHGWWGSPR